ncbi:hypothetical protein GEMRC1_000889 [Eukaryota sp. GEM-RC1]
MDEWCTRTHTGSGLVAKVKESSVTEDEAQTVLFDFISRYCRPGEGILAGNTIHADMVYVKKFFPKVANHLHYRLVDVSTIKEIYARKYPALPPLRQETQPSCSG